MANEFVARKGLISLADSQITGSLDVSSSVTASGYKGITLGGIDDVDVSSVQHEYGIIYNTASSQWEAADVGASGTVSDAQNQGTGVGVYKTKVGGTLQFRSLLSGSGGEITITQGADELTFDFDGTNVTELGTVTTGDITGILPGGTVSSSGQVDGASIQNNTVNFGGVSVALGSSDTTPAFDLQDATNYPGDSNLVTLGTVTSGDVSGILPGGIVSTSAQQVVSSYTNATDNRVVTSTGAGGINAEENMTFDGSLLTVTGDLTVSNKITAQEVWTQYITSSIGYLSGSTRFGSHPAASTTHEFTGSMLITGSTPTVNGTAVSLEGHTHAYSSLTGIPGGIVSSSGQVDGASIQNNTVNFGGVSVALGSSDTTPAFDLQDATNYPYASLTGIPGGIVSSSAQFNDGTDPFSGSFSGSFQGDGSGLTGVAGEVNFLQTTGSNLDVDTGTEVVATVNTGSYDSAWFDYVVKKTGGNLRAGTVTAVWDAAEAANGVEFTDVSTLDIGDTSDVTFEMDLLNNDARLKATVTSDNWSVKAIVRAI